MELMDTAEEKALALSFLKRLEDAKADKDPIHGCILAAVTNHSAEAESITRPHVGAQQALFSSVLAKGGVQPNDISYVEMHGTGTQAGDGREMTSVSQSPGSMVARRPAVSEGRPLCWLCESECGSWRIRRRCYSHDQSSAHDEKE